MCDQSFFADTIASLREAGDKLGTVMREVATKDAQIAIRDAEVKHLKHKVARAEEHSEALRDQIMEELSHHARYNAVKAEVKDFLDEGARSKLLAQARTRAEKLLAGFLKDQEAKYAEFDKTVKISDDAHAKKQAALRKELAAQAKAAAPEEAQSESDDEGAPRPGTLGSKATKAAKPKAEPKAGPKASLKPEAKPEPKKPANGAKGVKPTIAKKKDGKAAPKAKDEKPKRKGVTMPRARFIKEMTPMYNKEKDAATAEAKEARKEDFKFPTLFEWITEPWRNLDPAVKKRKYEDPYFAEKKQRDREEGGGDEEGEADPKPAAKATKKAKTEEKKAEGEQEHASAAGADDAQEEEQDEHTDGAESEDDEEGKSEGDGEGTDGEEDVPAVEDDEEDE